jgi:hypothetical protein
MHMTKIDLVREIAYTKQRVKARAEPSNATSCVAPQVFFA